MELLLQVVARQAAPLVVEVMGRRQALATARPAGMFGAVSSVFDGFGRLPPRRPIRRDSGYLSGLGRHKVSQRSSAARATEGWHQMNDRRRAHLDQIRA